MELITVTQYVLLLTLTYNPSLIRLGERRNPHHMCSGIAIHRHRFGMIIFIFPFNLFKLSS